MNILVSACLLGIACKYSGGDNACPALLQALQQSGHTLIPVCPEVYGGLPTPRPPAERCGDRVLTEAGADVTAQYRRGAEAALQLARLYNCRTAILKANSPSCGSDLPPPQNQRGRPDRSPFEGQRGAGVQRGHLCGASVKFFAKS